MATLESSLAAVAQSPTAPAPKEGETRLVDVSLLDENPWQPRVKMDAAELNELCESIKAHGLIQPIAVRPKADGRFVIVAGHRRVAAFEKLRAQSPEAEARRYARISAQVRLALDDAQLASMAYAENVTRAGLTPVEEARALERMVDAGLARTNEELSALTQQPLIKVRRLRRIGRAPKFLREAVDSGCVVALGEKPDGTPLEERRRVDLMAALQWVALFEHLQREQPKKAEERTASALRRSLAQSWSLRRVEDFVKGVVEGRASVEAQDAAALPAEADVFERTARRFVVDLSKLAAATAAQLGAVRAAFDAVLAEVAAGAGEGRNHR